MTELLAQLKPAITTLTDFYVTSANVQQVVVLVCNQGATDDAVRLAVSSGGNAIDPKDYVAYDYPVLAKDQQVLPRDGQTLAASKGSIFRVYSTTGNTSFYLSGSAAN